jgi:hypothetical protein
MCTELFDCDMLSTLPEGIRCDFKKEKNVQKTEIGNHALKKNPTQP